MLQQVYFFKEDNFKEDESFQLLIQTSDEFYGFTAFHPVEKKVYAWILYQIKNNKPLSESDLATIKQEQDWLHFSYAKTSIIDCGSRNTLIPEHLFSKEQELSELMFGIKPDDHFLKDRIASQNAVNIYAVPVNLYSLLQSGFRNSNWIQNKSLILQRAATENPRITVQIYFNSLLLTVEQNKQWLLLQNRNYQTPEDVLYHILNCKSQFQIDPEQTTIVLEGMVEENSALAVLLYQYLQNLEWNQQLHFQYPAEASSIPKQTLALTDRLLTCVL